MTLTVYPARDRFFSEGLAHLFSGKTPEEEIMVLNLAKWSLKEIVLSNWAEMRRMQPSFIITEHSLLPVADYLKSANGNSFVLNSGQLILPELCSEGLMTERLTSLSRKRSGRLTATEYRTLKCFFNLMTVDEEAWRYKVSNKTIYGMRSRVAAKLGIKTLNEILMW
ncbi:hypothetical protein F3J27_22540 [Enterobacter sp. Ap-916]|uniref:hypothetical protein n=1 Tax=Enterobacteriaceae TaxID=543 RepID=UPI0002729770|nr:MULTISPECIES: hypothetical protein [unclassified Enterobacter]EJF29553.1 hypothetical protein A936_18748 [Enterobacter sp. Ag1]NIF61077.1 hypothetical protein [Enterobacter sp. Ap-867]NIG32242.1 hypothetical protein [Enterobacter sp. Ap-916]